MPEAASSEHSRSASSRAASAPGLEAGTFVALRDEEIALRIPSEVPLARGLVLSFVVAPLAALACAGLTALLAPELLVTWLLTSLVSAVATLAPGLLGLAALLRAARSAGPVTRIDLGERLLHRPGRAPEVFHDPEAVIVARHGLGWRLSLDATRLLEGVPLGRGRALAADARRLAETLGAEARVPAAAESASLGAPPSPRTLAALAYAPLDPLPLLASAWALAAELHPKTRFAAQQSLLLLGVEGLLAGGILVGLGLPLALVRDHVPSVLTAGLLACPLVVLLLARTLVRGIAAMRAHRGEVWVMPWLAPLARGWAPLPAPAPARPLPRREDPPPPAPPPSTVLPPVERPKVAPSTKVGAGPWWT